MPTILKAEKPCSATIKIAVKGTSKEILWFIRASAAAEGLKPMVSPLGPEDRTWV